MGVRFGEAGLLDFGDFERVMLLARGDFERVGLCGLFDLDLRDFFYDFGLLALPGVNMLWTDLVLPGE